MLRKLQNLKRACDLFYCQEAPPVFIGEMLGLEGLDS